MEFICQKSAIKSLENLANSNVHSILICGSESCGKTYLATKYHELLHTDTFVKVDSNVQELKSILDSTIGLDFSLCICVENIDTGSNAAAQVLLKNLEEPIDNIYFVVTARNLKQVPATIISRSVCVNVNPPVSSDIVKYGIFKDKSKLDSLRNCDLWKCIKSFSDLDVLFKMTSDNINYILSIPDLVNSNKTISEIQWGISHYPDNSALPVNIAIRYLMNYSDSMYVKKICIDSLNSLNFSRIGEAAILAKLALELKYGC